MKKLLLIILSITLLIVSCGVNKSEEKKLEKLKVAATPIPAGEVLEVIKEDLKKEGIELEIVTFNDYIQPNKVLQSKEVDANLFQHTPYMENFSISCFLKASPTIFKVTVLSFLLIELSKT